MAGWHPQARLGGGSCSPHVCHLTLRFVRGVRSRAPRGYSDDGWPCLSPRRRPGSIFSCAVMRPRVTALVDQDPCGPDAVKAGPRRGVNPPKGQTKTATSDFHLPPTTTCRAESKHGQPSPTRFETATQHPPTEPTACCEVPGGRAVRAARKTGLDPVHFFLNHFPKQPI